MTAHPESRPATAQPVANGQFRPVTAWAAAGLLFVGVQLWAYGGWILSGDFGPNTTGRDMASTAVRTWAVITQVGTITAVSLAIIYVIRQVRRERKWTFDAMLLVGWASVAWQDPLLNYTRTVFFQNSVLINFGSWGPHIPGWASPRGENFVEPLFLGGFGYMWQLFIIIGVCAVMRTAKRRRPSLTNPQLFGVAFVAAGLFNLILELAWVRTEMYQWPGTVQWLSIWGGERYQFPIYEAVGFAWIWAAVAALRYFRDDKGRPFFERGGAQPVMPARRRRLVRQLAVIGFFNVIILPYMVWSNVAALNVDPTPEGYPAYLRNEQCGEGTPYACPSPEFPVPLRGSEAVDPEGQLVEP